MGQQMKKFYTALKYISDTAFVIGKYLGLISLFTILGAMILQVFMRYVIQRPLIWPEGLCKVLFIWMSYLAVGLVIRTRGHIAIDFLYTRFPGILQGIIKYVISGTMLFIIVIFGVYSLKFTLNTKAYIYELGMISEFWLWLSMPIAGLFMLVHMIFVVFEDIYKQFFQDKHN
jgi:TRAP-type C4-dicarboxylate transport system permease small subunit